MLGYVRVIIDPEGKMIGYEPSSLYYPAPQTLDFLQEVFDDGYTFDFSDTFTHDTESLVTFSIDTYQSNNYLDPIEYDFDLVIHNVTMVRSGYKESRRQELDEQRRFATSCRSESILDSETETLLQGWKVEAAEEIESLIEKWEEDYSENFYPIPLPASYIKESAATHDPFDIYLHGY